MRDAKYEAEGREAQFMDDLRDPNDPQYYTKGRALPDFTSLIIVP